MLPSNGNRKQNSKCADAHYLASLHGIGLDHDGKNVPSGRRTANVVMPVYRMPIPPASIHGIGNDHHGKNAPRRETRDHRSRMTMNKCRVVLTRRECECESNT